MKRNFIIFFCLFLMGNVNGQGIDNNSKYVMGSFQHTKPTIRRLWSSSLIVTYKDSTTTEFTISQDRSSKGKFIKRNDSIFKVDSQNRDTVLFYDYTLKVGDTFFYKNDFALGMVKDSFVAVVEHIDSIELRDGTKRKRWQFRMVQNPTSMESDNFLTWIENLGASFIWDYSTSFFEYGEYTELICNSSGVPIFWSRNYNDTPVCDDVWRYLSAKKLSKEKVIIYPVPVESKLYIKGVNTGRFTIFSMNGKVEGTGDYTDFIDVGMLQKGLFTLKIDVGKQTVIKRFIKSD